MLVCVYDRVGLSVGLLLWSYRVGGHEVRLLFSIDEYLVGLVVLWAGCAGIEAAIMCVSVQGTILDTKSRSIMPLLVYIRLGEFLCFSKLHSIQYISIVVIPLIEMCGCHWFKSRHVV